MDSISGFAIFVLVAESRNFASAGRQLGISSSAVGKSVARLEERLGVRLLHRSTRSITMTYEGELFLERCKRILSEVEAAKQELSHAAEAPRGKLRISLPLVGGLLNPILANFIHHYPEVELELDFTDRLSDVIEEGLDAVIRSGEPNDSRLMSRRLGSFRLAIVGSPEYFKRNGVPESPQDLLKHRCFHYRFSSSGKFERWPFRKNPNDPELKIPVSMVCNTIESLIYAAIQGHGITCVPDFSIRDALQNGTLRTILDEYTEHTGTFRVLWPSNRHMPPKLRVFINFICEHIPLRDAAST
ncbi:LysR family transcriptional regulator [Chromobacterium sp. ASV23]|uniref:LysR family transcriptional regulator n=1 Tax=Chromobacterium sp. ASV23 TaxID=2795110 RepID=UPI0018EDEBAC|nr:LysR family transcriptional regulator [Chromobacterium sp. ASV23]